MINITAVTEVKQDGVGLHLCDWNISMFLSVSAMIYDVTQKRLERFNEEETQPEKSDS